MRLRGIFDHEKAAGARELKDGIHVGGLSEKMNRDNRLRPRRDRVGETCGIKGVCPLVDIDEDGRRSAISDGFRRRHERARHGDDFVPGPNASRE